MTEINFCCPICCANTIEEIMVDVAVASEIRISKYEEDETGPSCIETNYGDQTNDGGHVDRYQCGGCGYTIVDHNSPHSDDGLDVDALAKAIEALNTPPGVKGEEVSHADLVDRIADAHTALSAAVLKAGRVSSNELAIMWNVLFPKTPVVYEGPHRINARSSLYWVKK